MPDREIHNVETHHEKSDVNVRALLWSVVIFVIFAFVTHAVLYVMFRFFAEIARGQTNEPMTELARPANMAMPPSPRLQPLEQRDEKNNVIPPNVSTPVTDLADMRSHEEEALTTPAWIDKSKGSVRLPIDVAKQLIVQRGLPVNNGAPAPAPPATATTTTGGAQ